VAQPSPNAFPRGRRARRDPNARAQVWSFLDGALSSFTRRLLWDQSSAKRCRTQSTITGLNSSSRDVEASNIGFVIAIEDATAVANEILGTI